MSMTRKDFECLAGTLAYARLTVTPTISLQGVWWVTEHVAEAFKSTRGSTQHASVLPPIPLVCVRPGSGLPDDRPCGS